MLAVPAGVLAATRQIMRSFQTGQFIHVALSLDFIWAVANLDTGANSPCVPRAGENLGYVSICFEHDTEK